MTRLLVFDSGFGGLTVHRRIARLAPALDLIYLADDAAFPYGDWLPDPLVGHVLDVIGRAISDHRPDGVVIACNTASTLVLEPLRAAFALPFVGTVPAIKPACAATRSGLVSVLATPGTVSRDYTRGLIDRFAGGAAVTLVGSAALAGMAERRLRGQRPDDAAIRAEIAGCFVERAGARTDHIVLACTHFPLLLDAFERLAPWPVTWIDPADAIARQVTRLLAVDPPARPGERRFLTTSNRPFPAEIAAEWV